MFVPNHDLRRLRSFVELDVPRQRNEGPRYGRMHFRTNSRIENNAGIRIVQQCTPLASGLQRTPESYLSAQRTIGVARRLGLRAPLSRHLARRRKLPTQQRVARRTRNWLNAWGPQLVRRETVPGDAPPFANEVPRRLDRQPSSCKPLRTNPLHLHAEPTCAFSLALIA
jgi:hypothetical protein